MSLILLPRYETGRASYRHGGRLTRVRAVQQRRRAVAGSLLLHGLVLLLVAGLAQRALAPEAPAESSVAMVFEAPSQATEAAPAIAAPAAAPATLAQPDVSPPPPAPTPAMVTPEPDLEEQAQSPAATEPTNPPPPPMTPDPDRQQQVESPKLPAPVMPTRQATPRAVAHAASRPATVAQPSRPVAENAASGAALAAVVPARPLAGMASDRPPTYPETARRRGEQGRVMLLVAVSPGGSAVTVTVAASSGFASLDSAAVHAVQQWRFTPATRAGEPIAGTAEVPVQFRLVD